MSLQSNLISATNRIINARQAVAEAERDLVVAKSNVAVYAARLETARRTLMGRSDAGSNDAARRAYAERETVNERDDLAFAESDLAVRELAMSQAVLALRVAEDERRCLEFLARLAIAGVGDADGLDEAAENGNGERYTLDAANRDLF